MVRLLVLVLIVLGGLGGWACWPSHPQAAHPEDPAENGPETARYRWETDQPTHWRYVVIPRE